MSELPQSGRAVRGAWRRGEWRPAVREEARCSHCGHRVIHWRPIGTLPVVVRCNQEDAEACRARSGVPLSKTARENARKARKRREARASQPCVQPAPDPRPRCPRPDKEPWATKEGAEHIVRLMREKDVPRARDLHAYLCECGSYHVGDRTRYVGDAAAQRWGSAYRAS